MLRGEREAAQIPFVKHTDVLSVENIEKMQKVEFSGRI
jgi:hypothetical protein